MRDKERDGSDVKSKAKPKNPMVEYVVKEFMMYEQCHRERFDRDAVIYDHWCNKPPKRDYSWQNAVHVPVTVEAEQTITPRIYSSLFPISAPVEVVTGNDVSPQSGIKIREYIKHNFVQANVQGESLTALTQCVLFGTGYLYTPWKIDRRWLITETNERSRGIVGQYTDAETVNYFEMYPHPAKLHAWDDLPLIRQRFADAEYIKNLAEDPRYSISGNILSEALDSETLEVNKRLVDAGAAMFRSKKRESYEILEYWGPWDISYEKDSKVVTKKAVPYWIIVINRSVLLFGQENPYNHQRAPFVKMKFFEDPQPSWFGVGVGVVGKSTQERLNKLVNQRLDNVDLVLNKMGVYNANDTLINKKRLRTSMPGLWHGAADVNNLKWMDMPDVTASSYHEEDLAKNDFREATGATMTLMPSEDPQHRTATGINMLQGAAGMRFKSVLRRMEVDFIQDIAEQMLSNAKQFMSFPEDVVIEKEDGTSSIMQISPADLMAKAYFIPTGVSETLNKEMQMAQLLRFKELTQQDPTINRAEINKVMAELLGLKNIQKLIVPQQQGGAGGPLDQNQRQTIKQRLAEGASPDQIKEELLGAAPSEGAAPAGPGAGPEGGMNG
jgi:hypothetical protein